MILQQLHMLNFKTYFDCKAVFSEHINLITGHNGAGKTNLLDAIYCLSMTKSAFANSDSNLISHGKNFFSLRADFLKNDKSNVLQYDIVDGKKNISHNKISYSKITDHIGEYPVVLITPYDTDLIRDGSEERRKFFDAIIAQTDKNYLQELIMYNKVLKQRNVLLKWIAEGNSIDNDLIDTYNHELIKKSKIISAVRSKFIEQYIPFFKSCYRHICASTEIPDIQYSSQALELNFATRFKNQTQKDIATQRTSMGIHRDDFVFNLNDKPIKQFGSQGQQKTFVLSLKLAQYEYIKHHKHLKPLLLLDDIFDKLDDERVLNLLSLIAQNTFGQVFITDARPNHNATLVNKLSGNIRIFEVTKGNIKPV
ncbi:MAG: DNA replication and repair protein RecF [Cytophagaceae bacterium]|nr:DNA replication and repair protein RecF [Cytophagaceae bacterium]MDW8455715.1 DNA replication and repair protein RecF [Cytophagaceae bacterium]